jgi:hypothetical protein
MKQIEAFVDEVYHSVGGNEKEIQELKDEMKNHLLEAVQELKLEGKSEQEAIDIAIEQFGGEKEIRSVVGQLFKAQKVFAKSVLYIALSFLILTSSVCGALWFIDKRNKTENYNTAHTIVNLLEGKEEITEDISKEIKALIQNKDQILNVEIYKYIKEQKEIVKNGETIIVSTFKKENETPSFEYNSGIIIPNWRSIDKGYEFRDLEWYVQMESKKIFAFIPFIFNTGIAIYVTLFVTWATINAYHHRRLNAGWVIAFALLNVVGYFIYVLEGKRKITA